MLTRGYLRNRMPPDITSKNIRLRALGMLMFMMVEKNECMDRVTQKQSEIAASRRAVLTLRELVHASVRQPSKCFT